jgi:hypothetical protein
MEDIELYTITRAENVEWGIPREILSVMHTQECLKSFIKYMATIYSPRTMETYGLGMEEGNAWGPWSRA